MHALVCPKLHISISTHDIFILQKCFCLQIMTLIFDTYVHLLVVILGRIELYIAHYDVKHLNKHFSNVHTTKYLFLGL